MNKQDLYEAIWTRKLKTFSPRYEGDNFRIELFRRAVNEGWVGSGRESLLDIGCGNGYLLEVAAGLFEEAIGIDISNTAVARAEEKELAAYACDVDGGKIPWRDGRFDCITCLDTIEHVFDPEHVISESARLLKPGGALFIVTPNIMYHGWLQKLFEGHFPITSLDPEMYNGGHLHHLTYYDIADLMSKFGLIPVRHSRDGGNPPPAFLDWARTYYKLGNETLDFGDTVVIVSGNRPA